MAFAVFMIIVVVCGNPPYNERNPRDWTLTSLKAAFRQKEGRFALYALRPGPRESPDKATIRIKRYRLLYSVHLGQSAEARNTDTRNARDKVKINYARLLRKLCVEGSPQKRRNTNLGLDE